MGWYGLSQQNTPVNSWGEELGGWEWGDVRLGSWELGGGG